MNRKTILFACMAASLTLFSCKKDETTTPPVNNDPEKLGAETSKILHYSFNGNLNDGSGNSMNALSSGNISFAADRFGRTSQAAVFGGPGNTSYIVTPSLKSKNVGFPFAVSFWMKANSVTGNQTLIRADGAQTNLTNYTGFWIQLGVTGAGSMAVNFGNNTSTSGNGRNSLITPNVISPNTWYHVVVNFKGANDIEFYLNGTRNMDAYYDGSATDIVFADPENPGVMGVYGGGVPSDFGGLLDDYRIYKKALSQTEISALYSFAP